MDHLRTVVTQQYQELRRSIAGLGDFQLTPSFAGRHLTSQMRWTAMTDEMKDKAFKKLMKDNGELQSVIFICYSVLYFTNDSVISNSVLLYAPTPSVLSQTTMNIHTIIACVFEWFFCRSAQRTDHCNVN